MGDAKGQSSVGNVEVKKSRGEPVAQGVAVKHVLVKDQIEPVAQAVAVNERDQAPPGARDVAGKERSEPVAVAVNERDQPGAQDVAGKAKGEPVAGAVVGVEENEDSIHVVDAWVSDS